MDVPPRYSLSIHVRPRDPQEVRGVFRGLRIATFVRPERAEVDEGGDWENEIRGVVLTSTFRERARAACS